MAGAEYHLNGRTQEAMIEDARNRGIRGRMTIMAWPPLHDTQAWARLRALSADRPTTYVARLFPDDVPTTKAYEEYLERYFRFVDDATSFDATQTIHGLSSTTRTCKHCGSHIAVEHVDGELCPVCNADLRSNTVQKTLMRWHERISKVREQGEAEAMKAGWLGSWAAVHVDGSERDADGLAEARHDSLQRHYDSKTISLDAGSDEEQLYVPYAVAERLVAQARAQGLSPARYLEDMLDRQVDA